MSGFGTQRRARRALPPLLALRPGVTTPAVHRRRSGFGQHRDAALYDSSGPPAR